MATNRKSTKRSTQKRILKEPPHVDITPGVAEAKVEQPVVVAAPEKKMKPIWYMVGLVLLSIGGLIFLTGIYYLIYPPPARVVMAHLQPDLWWGAVMVLAGATFVYANRHATVG